MKTISSYGKVLMFSLFSFVLCSCSYNSVENSRYPERERAPYNPHEYTSRLPSHITTGEKTVVVDPKQHAWGAYASSGELVRGGEASAGSDWCSDLGHPCHTRTGSYRVYSLGSPDCHSHIFPIPRGGAPMPYCMYFNGGQALHGSPEGEVVDGNVSHGCVRMHVSDAEWLRYNFVNVGTKVVIRSYND